MPTPPFVSSFSRVFFQRGGSGAALKPGYHGNWRAGTPSWDQGDLTTIREPDPATYGRFINVGRYRGEPGNPELSIMARYTLDKSVLLAAARDGCDNTLHVHMGECQNPQDFNRGWTKKVVLERAGITSYGTDADLGAMEPGDTSPVNEDVPFTGLDYYEVSRLNMSSIGGAVLTREVTSIYVCDRAQCGACGASTDGCQVVLALEGALSASPGLPPTVLYSTDGGTTWAEVSITTLGANESGSALVCIGENTVVFSADSESLHYANTADLVLGSPTWTEVTTGFVATHGPLAVFSLGANETWIVGEGGYIYFTDDPTLGVEVSDAGSATVEDLNDVHAIDSLNIVAVGDNNAMVSTSNGGASWEAITGPAVGVALNAIWMHTLQEWYVGAANGNLYYTLNAGTTWTQKAFTGDGAGSVRDIVFVTPSVGYMAHSTAAPAGRILRTTDGGYSWYVIPEGTGNIPANDYVAQLALCGDPNIVFGGGLADNAVDGFIVKAA